MSFNLDEFHFTSGAFESLLQNFALVWNLAMAKVEKVQISVT
jgi:hypothetical protein